MSYGFHCDIKIIYVEISGQFLSINGLDRAEGMKFYY